MEYGGKNSNGTALAIQETNGNPDVESSQFVELSQELSSALRRLNTAKEFAANCDVSTWEFAIEIEQLQATGVTAEELRWLIAKQMVHHADEVSPSDEENRKFESCRGLKLSSRSCFVISDLGVEVIKKETDVASKPEPILQVPSLQTPLWDKVRHELKLGSILVKKFKWRASNQEAILSAFQEDGWPAHIFDPLVPHADINPKRRLSDAIKCLNRKQVAPRIRFSGDGTGQGVLWEVR
jgi:hypothetical protein